MVPLCHGQQQALKESGWFGQWKKSKMPGPSLRELRRRTGRVVRLRHKGTGLGDDVIMLPGANATSCMSLRNESCSHGFVSQDSMSGTPLTTKADRKG